MTDQYHRPDRWFTTSLTTDDHEEQINLGTGEYRHRRRETPGSRPNARLLQESWMPGQAPWYEPKQRLI